MPLDSDEDDGDFVPESELGDTGVTPAATPQGGPRDDGASPYPMHTSSSPVSPMWDGDEDDQVYSYDPNDPDLYEPIEDVPVPPPSIGQEWPVSWSMHKTTTSPPTTQDPVLNSQDRDAIVEQLRAHVGR